MRPGVLAVLLAAALTWWPAAGAARAAPIATRQVIPVEAVIDGPDEAIRISGSALALIEVAFVGDGGRGSGLEVTVLVALDGLSGVGLRCGRPYRFAQDLRYRFGTAQLPPLSDERSTSAIVLFDYGGRRSRRGISGRDGRRRWTSRRSSGSRRRGRRAWPFATGAPPAFAARSRGAGVRHAQRQSAQRLVTGGVRTATATRAAPWLALAPHPSQRSPRSAVPPHCRRRRTPSRQICSGSP